MDELEAADLFLAYTRRQRFVAKLIARELAEVLGSAMGAKTSAPRQSPQQRRMSADSFLADAGMSLE